MTTAAEVLKTIRDNDVKYVDFRFTDPRGKWQHVTFDVSLVDDEIFEEGTMFDGSSIAGWKAINESDMLLMPDPATATMDPFFSAATMVIVCDVLEPSTGAPYPRDPRGTAKLAEAYLKSTGIGDTIYVGPEAEFFVFDDVKFGADPYHTGFQLDSTELPSNGFTDYEGGNLGHRVADQGRLLPGSAAGFGPGHARRDAGRDAGHGREGGEAPPRGRERPARARHEVRHADAARRPHADLQVLHPQRRAELRQDRDLHAEAGLRRQRLGHARAPVDLEGRQADLRRRQVRGPLPGMPLVHRRHHQARQGARTPSPTRRPTPTSAWCRATRRPCCSPTRRATARPPAASRGRRARRPSASRSASPIRWPTPTSPSRRC